MSEVHTKRKCDTGYGILIPHYTPRYTLYTPHFTLTPYASTAFSAITRLYQRALAFGVRCCVA